MGLDRFYYNGQIVITRKQLAEMTGINEQTMRRNYERYRRFFIEGEHTYNLRGENFKEFKRQNLSIFKKYFVNRYCTKLVVYTFQGCLFMLSNMNIHPNELISKLDRLKQYFLIDTETNILLNQIRKENVSLARIRKMLEGIDICVSQYKVGDYRVDLYCPSLKLAIEFDEAHHKYCVEEDLKRQEYIERQLGCQFVRINENEDFEISANKILKAILNNQNIKRSVV